MTETKKRGRPPVKKTVAATETVETPKVEKKVARRRDLNELIDVKCIVHGGLNHLTAQGLVIRWEEFGSVVPVEYKELLYMASTYRRFFEEPWIIMEQDVLEDLRVARYYKEIIDYDEIDSLFTKTPEQVQKIMDKVPNGTKQLIADRATVAMKEGRLDSVKVINVLEKALDMELL